MGSQCPGHCTVNIGSRANEDLSIGNDRQAYPQSTNTSRPINDTKTFSANLKPAADPRLAKEALKKAIQDCQLDGIAKKLGDQGGAFKDEELFRSELNALVSSSLAPALELAQAAGVPKDEVHKLMAELGARISSLHKTKAPENPAKIGTPIEVKSQGVNRILEDPDHAQKTRGVQKKARCPCLKWLLLLSLAAACLLGSVWLLHSPTSIYEQEVSFLNRVQSGNFSGADSLFELDRPVQTDDLARDRAVLLAIFASASVLLALAWQRSRRGDTMHSDDDLQAALIP